MADTFNLQVVVLDRTVFSGPARSVVVPAADGYLGVLPNHAPLLATIGEGDLTIQAESGDEHYGVKGGFLEVLDNHVTVLADEVI